MTGHIERIRVFIEVAERQSFAAAARALGLSRSIATRYVSELEAELGVQLMTRTTRKVALNSAGQIYLERTKVFLADLSRTEDLVRQQQQTLKGTLRVSVPLSFGLRFLPDVVSQFRILYPAMELKLNLTDRFVDIVREDFDMALRISGPPTDKTTIWRKICQVPRILVAAPSYLARKGTPKNPDDLEGHDCLGYANLADGTAWELQERKHGRIKSVAITSCFSCNNGDLISDLAVRGEGIALLPRFIVAKDLERNTLVEVLSGWKGPEIWLAAYYPPYTDLPAKLQTFTSFVESRIAAEPSLLR